jgi:hypothetical protein
MTTITREALSRMTAAELRAAIKDLDAEAIRLHYDERGDVRDHKTDDEQAAFDANMELHDRARSLLQVREAYERNPRAVVPGATFHSPAFHPSHPGVDWPCRRPAPTRCVCWRTPTTWPPRRRTGSSSCCGRR